MFRAYDPDRERLVAIKLLRLDLPPERVHRLLTELEWLVIAGLTHPGITAPLAAGIDGNSAYLVQEFVAAESLDIVVRDYGPAPPADTLGLADQLAAALDFAAGLNVTAGTLHPRDVLVSPDEARLTGLGVASALKRAGVAPPVRRPYAAPERVAGEIWDRRADIFSLAAILHEMLWGRRTVGHGQQVADLLTELPAADLKALRVVFARALAEDPADRFGTALELAAALKSAFPEIARRELPVVRTHAVEGRLPLDTPGGIDAIDATEIGGDFDLHAEPADKGSAMLSSNQENPIEREPHYDLLDAGRTEPGGSVIDRSRSAMWPLALALIVGLALGFASGVRSRLPTP